MSNRKKLDVRIDSDLHAYLTKNAKKNFTSYVESLIVKGLILDVGEICNSMISRAEGVYDSALDAVKNKELEAKAEEYNLLLSKIDESRSYIDTQVNLMVNMCFSEGVDREKIERYSNDVDEENDVSTKAKFVNRLAVELARAKGYDGETIKGWVKKN